MLVTALVPCWRAIGLAGFGLPCRRARAIAAAVVAIIGFLTSLPASAKTPGAVHCYGKWCHRVSTMDEMDGMVGRRGIIRASYYDNCKVDRFNTCNLTSSGEVFRPDAPDNAASPIFPDGTVILAFNPKTRKAAVLRINSAGPYHGDRRLDVSRASADSLGFRKEGVADLMVAVLKSPEFDEARYKKNRSYDRVPGYLGAFDTFDTAHDAAIERLRMNLGITISALDEGETTPLPPPEDADDEIGNLVPIDLRPVAPKLDHARRVDESPGEIAASAREDAARVTTIEAAGAPSSAGDVRDSPAVLGETPPAVLEPRLAHDALPHAAAASAEVAALDERSSSAIAPPPDREAITARDAQIRDDVLSGLRSGFDRFLAAARAKAREGLPPRPPAARVTVSWRKRIEIFIRDAREKARAGVAHDGPLTRLTMELKIKAQPPRFSR